jgi:recombinational DNA repair ATPase RecF
MELKWTNNKPYERSRRLKHIKELNEMNSNEMDSNFEEKIEKNAYLSSLNYDENTWDILNQSLSGAGFKVSNKREEIDSKIANRELVQQIGFNPFLNQTQNTYLNDVSIRDQYLKPLNTTQGFTKSNKGDNE